MTNSLDWRRSLQLLLAATLLAVLPPTHAAEFAARVVAIVDGDTLTAVDTEHQKYRIRLAGIDASEKGQAFGERSRQHLATLAFGKDVRVLWKKRDRYGRIVGTVMVEAPDAPCDGKPECPKTLDVSLAQLTAGLAWWYRKYAQEQTPEERVRYERAEFEAKMRRAGLWAEKNPLAPWDWRHAGRVR